MNREIKFRGKRLDDGEWLYGSLVGIDDTAFIINRDDIDWNPNTDIYAFWFDNQDCLVNSATVGQFTGLHDRTGKEVYEGDILRINGFNTEGEAEEWVVEVGQYGEVAYSTADSDYSLLAWIDNFVEYEVVGNIHDNPKLLKS